jgi:rhodanese-related sulfurtransferase
MSAAAAPVLAGLGFTDIVELRGGMQAWVADGRSLITTE